MTIHRTHHPNDIDLDYLRIEFPFRSGAEHAATLARWQREDRKARGPFRRTRRGGRR